MPANSCAKLPLSGTTVHSIQETRAKGLKPQTEVLVHELASQLAKEASSVAMRSDLKMVFFKSVEFELAREDKDQQSFIQ